MAVGLQSGYRTEYSVGTVDFNQSANTVLATFFMPRKGRIRRYGVVAEASQGLLAAFEMNLNILVQGGASGTEVTGSILDVAANRARGIAVVKTLTTRIDFNAGELVEVRVDVDAGGTSTGRVWIEVEDEPHSGSNIPSTWIVAA